MGCALSAGSKSLRSNPRIRERTFLSLPPRSTPCKKKNRLHWGADQNIEQLNPLSVSVQQCEDFISRPSRLSRRVTGGHRAPERVTDRYLMASYPQWIAAGYLVRPG